MNYSLSIIIRSHKFSIKELWSLSLCCKEFHKSILDNSHYLRICLNSGIKTKFGVVQKTFTQNIQLNAELLKNYIGDFIFHKFYREYQKFYEIAPTQNYYAFHAINLDKQMTYNEFIQDYQINNSKKIPIGVLDNILLTKKLKTVLYKKNQIEKRIKCINRFINSITNTTNKSIKPPDLIMNVCKSNKINNLYDLQKVNNEISIIQKQLDKQTLIQSIDLSAWKHLFEIKQEKRNKYLDKIGNTNKEADRLYQKYNLILDTINQKNYNFITDRCDKAYKSKNAHSISG